MIEPQPNPQVEPHVRAAVAEVVRRGLSGQELVDALTERMTALYSDLLLADHLSMIGNALADMPETERKAKMFDALMSIQAFDRGGENRGR